MAENQPGQVESQEAVETEAAGVGAQATTGGSFQEQAARMLRLKIDGEDMDMPEDEVIRYAQMGRKANKTIQEAAYEKKRIMRLREMARENPMAVLKEFNPEFDEDNYIHSKLEKQMERNMKSREELERDDALEELQHQSPNLKKHQRKCMDLISFCVKI